jgi:hypothetical protein
MIPHMKHGHVSFRGGIWKATPEYRAWKNMRSRCNLPSNPRYPQYGGRGIRVAERWNDFSQFFADVGERPTSLHSLDRIDVNGHYEPGNVKWSTEHDQQRNRTNNRWISVGGRTMVVTDWAKELGIDPRRIFNRLAKGWSEERAVTTVRASRWGG